MKAPGVFVTIRCREHGELEVHRSGRYARFDPGLVSLRCPVCRQWSLVIDERVLKSDTAPTDNHQQELLELL